MKTRILALAFVVLMLSGTARATDRQFVVDGYGNVVAVQQFHGRQAVVVQRAPQRVFVQRRVFVRQRAPQRVFIQRQRGLSLDFRF